VKQRNARLAEALGIKGAEGRNGGDGIEWSGELKAFAAGNWAFVRMVETALADFMKGGKQSHILPQSKYSPSRVGS
jgi:transcriptional repressor NF-X1